jgi:tRNA G18 (ribose-2'-O)-methylase SpoU
MENADLKVKIPMSGKVNSLNVSIAAALMTYEAARQRAE